MLAPQALTVIESPSTVKTKRQSTVTIQRQLTRSRYAPPNIGRKFFVKPVRSQESVNGMRRVASNRRDTIAGVMERRNFALVFSRLQSAAGPKLFATQELRISAFSRTNVDGKV